MMSHDITEINRIIKLFKIAKRIEILRNLKGYKVNFIKDSELQARHWILVIKDK